MRVRNKSRAGVTQQCVIMPRSHIHGLDAGLATDVHLWQSVLVRSFPYCIPDHT